MWVFQQGMLWLGVHHHHTQPLCHVGALAQTESMYLILAMIPSERIRGLPRIAELRAEPGFKCMSFS